MSDIFIITCFAAVPFGIVAAGIAAFLEQSGKASVMNAEARLLEARRALSTQPKGEDHEPG